MCPVQTVTHVSGRSINGSRNKGLAAEQRIFYKNFLRNLRTSPKTQYWAKARKSDAPPKVSALQAHQDQRQVALLPSSDLFQREGQAPRCRGRRTGREARRRLLL